MSKGSDFTFCSNCKRPHRPRVGGAKAEKLKIAGTLCASFPLSPPGPAGPGGDSGKLEKDAEPRLAHQPSLHRDKRGGGVDDSRSCILRFAYCTLYFALPCCAGLSVAFPPAASAVAAEKDGAGPAAKLITPAADRSIGRGLAWLAGSQRDDGSFGRGQFRGNAAVTALAAMAMMAGGSTPGRGPLGRHVDRAVDYLLSTTQPSGFIAGGDTNHPPMYGHGFAAMCLAECYGMSPRPELRDKLAKAVKLIVETQNKEGGWRYQPQREAEADISVTACEVMALRAARNTGLFVPSGTIDRSIGYLKRSQNADGGFRYMLRSRESAFPRSAAALAALYCAGVYQGPEITRGLDYLEKRLPPAGGQPLDNYYFYGHYYAAQAMWQAGGARLARCYPAIRDDLISRQQADGSWTSDCGKECSTAMACLVLQVPNDYLPIFQR